VVAVAASHQRTPARRPLPVAADTRRLRRCTRWPAPSDTARGSASIVGTEHCGSRPVGAPDTAAARSGQRRGQAGHRRQAADAATVPAPAAVVRPARQKRGPLTCAGQPRQTAKHGRTPASDGADTGHAFRTTAVPEHLAQRRLVDGRVPRALRQPSRPDSGLPAMSAAITTGRQRPLPSGSVEAATASVEPRLGVGRLAHAHHCGGVEHPGYDDGWPVDQGRVAMGGSGLPAMNRTPELTQPQTTDKASFPSFGELWHDPAP